MTEQAIRVPDPDPVNHPPHYTNGPAHSACGQVIECIDVAEPLGFNLGNAVKYLWRAEHKGTPVDDLRKARWYLDREIVRRQGPPVRNTTLAIPQGMRVVETPGIRRDGEPMRQVWCDNRMCDYGPVAQVFDADKAARLANEHYQREHVNDGKEN